MTKKKRLMLFASLLILILSFLIYRDYINKEITLRVDFVQDVQIQTEFGGNFTAYDRETIMSWLNTIKNSEHDETNKTFDPNQSLGGIYISEGKGSIAYYRSNIYVDEQYVYLNALDHQEEKVRIEKDKFKALPRKVQSFKNILNFYLKGYPQGLEY